MIKTILLLFITFPLWGVCQTPNAEFTYVRMGNTFSFKPATEDIKGNFFYWEFGTKAIGEMRTTGDVTPEEFYQWSNSPFPIITFPAGKHRVYHSVTDTSYFSTGEVTKYIVVEGIEDYTPKRGSVGGDFDLVIYGGGLGAATQVMLKKEATVLKPMQIIVNAAETRLTALFNLHAAQPGMYDLVVQIPGMEDSVIYEKGMEITKLAYPETYSEVTGANIWRNTSAGSLSLSVFNKGSVMASGVVAALIWPKDIEITFNENVFYKLSGTGTETVQLDGETFSLPRADYRFIYDSLDKPTAIDTFNMEPYDGYIKYILIPHVPAHGLVEIPFTARSISATVGKIKFHTYTLKTNQRGSCDNPVYANFNENLTAELIDGMDMAIDHSGVVPLKVLSKTAKIGQKHAGSMSSYLGKKFWAWYDGYEFDADGAMADWMAETESNNAFALQTATDELGGLLLNKASAKLLDNYKSQVDFINKRLAANPNMSAALTEKYLNKLNSLPHDQMRRFEALKGIFDNTKNLGTLSDKLVKLQMLADECPELAQQINDLIRDLEKELNIRDPKEKESELSNSYDPNMISGPSGIGQNRYLNNTDYQAFTISFENLQAATASAQIVRVYDTLDKDKYDLSTFAFGSVGIGNKVYRIPRGRQQFVIERNIEQDIPVKVRISAGLDTATGVVQWQFTAIDTTTDQLPVLEGFLPPNVHSPEGQGFVRFMVKPKDDLADGAVFENQATIFFDQNEPIATNTWRNVLDLGKPASTLSATVLSDTLIKLDLNGHDAVSGIGYYNLYVKINNGEWTSLGGASADTLTLVGEQDSTYSFYVVSQDKVGNIESKGPSSEATVTLARVLDVRFGRLTGVNLKDENLLAWNTFSEDKGDYFVIERSGDGKNFVALSEIHAKGLGANYSYTDHNPLQGNNYYRIKILNMQGRYFYSNVVVVKLKSNMQVAAFPNPVKNTLLVTIPEGRAQGGQLLLINIFGQKIYHNAVPGNRVEIDMKKLASGMYYLIYRANGKEEKFKIIKE